MKPKSTVTERVKTDPELARQLDDPSADAKPVEAVFRLRPGNSLVVSPEKTEQLTKRVLQRVTNRVGQSAHALNIFRNLGSFVVAARPVFLRELLSQPEIASAMANQRPTGLLIPPRNKKTVNAPRTRRSTRLQKSDLKS